jgi:hypothetical protein
VTPYAQPVITWRGGIHQARLPGKPVVGFGSSPEAAVKTLRALLASPNLRWSQLKEADRDP